LMAAVYDYPNMRRVVYEGGARFIPVCEKCKRFVKPDKSVRTSEGNGLADEPNATCSVCGRTKMLFEGFF